MTFTDEIVKQAADDWIPLIYIESVKTQKTRSFTLDVPQKENTPEIVHTLLGIQLKTGKRLIGCPDLSTARYLRVFARVGIREIAVPYDISKISTIADTLESAWQRLLLLMESGLRHELLRAKSQKRSAVIRRIRQELEKAGAGAMMPAFDTETKQRRK